MPALLRAAVASTSRPPEVIERACLSRDCHEANSSHALRTSKKAPWTHWSQSRLLHLYSFVRTFPNITILGRAFSPPSKIALAALNIVVSIAPSESKTPLRLCISTAMEFIVWASTTWIVLSLQQRSCLPVMLPMGSHAHTARAIIQLRGCHTFLVLQLLVTES